MLAQQLARVLAYCSTWPPAMPILLHHCISIRCRGSPPEAAAVQAKFGDQGPELTDADPLLGRH